MAVIETVAEVAELLVMGGTAVIREADDSAYA